MDDDYWKRQKEYKLAAKMLASVPDKHIEIPKFQYAVRVVAPREYSDIVPNFKPNTLFRALREAGVVLFKKD